jgi:hypothetical protein
MTKFWLNNVKHFKNNGAFKLESRPKSFFDLNAQKTHKDAFRDGMRTIFSHQKKLKAL